MFNFTAWPEMLAWPYLMLQGWLPYRDIAIAHNPLLLLDLAIFYSIFGIGILQLKIYTWILIIFNAYLTYFVAKKFYSMKVAFISTIFYILYTFVFEGNGLWFDLALTPFALLLYYFVKQKNYFWTGIIFALGFLTKQTFIYFLIPVTIYILHSTFYKKSILKFLFGSGFIIAIFLSYLAFLGILDDYYKWAIQFGIFYLPSAVGQVSFPTLKQLIFVLLPFSIFFFTKHKSLLTFAIIGALGVYPRFELFHFQPAIPFLSIAIASFVFSKKSIVFKCLVLVFSMLYIVYGINKQLGTTTRFYEDDVRKIASLITSHPAPITSLYVINYWDNLYALTETYPATKPLIPYIPWYLNYNNTKATILNDLKIKMPQVIVIGERDKVFPEIYDFIDRYYLCNIVESKIEICKLQ